MKFNVPGKAFYDQLAAVGKVINAKNTLSILDNFLLTVKDNILYITGSDQENEVVATLEVFEADEDGSVAISAKTLIEITKELTSQPLTFEVDKSSFSVKLSYLTGYFDFFGVNPAEFPNKEEKETEVVASFSLPISEVRRALDMTLYAVSTEQIRPMMTGIFWDIEEDKATFVSSDTHKLVKYTNSMAEPGVKTSFILPAKPASILRSLLVKEEGDVKIVTDSKGATFTFDNFTISCHFIKGNYPNYNRVIPTDNPFSLVTDRQMLLSALRRVSISASRASSLVRLEISETEIRILGQDLDYSTLAEDRVDCQYQGNPMTIGFNAQYCQQVLTNMTCETVRIELSNPARPGVFIPMEEEENETLVAIQMPMQVLD